MQIRINNINIRDIDYDKLINYLLIAYALVLPISKAGTNIFESLIILVWLLQGNWKEKYLLYKNNLFFQSLFMLIIISVLSIPYAISTEFALDYIAKYKHFLIILPIFSSFEMKFFKPILSSFLLGMLFSEIVSYGIFFEWWTYKNISPSDPTPFMDHVSYSVYLAFTSIILLTRLMDLTETDVKLKLMYFIFLISSTTNLFINGGRTGQVTFLALIILSVFLSFKNTLQSIFISATLILSIIFLAYNYSPVFKNRINQAYIGIEQMVHHNNYKADGFSQRVAVWIVGFDNVKDNFLFGKGLGNDTKDMSYYLANRGLDTKFFSGFGDNHNMFLIVALQFGILGLIIMFIIFYSIFILKFKSNVIKTLNLTFIFGFLLWSLGNTTFHTMNPMTFFALFAGIFNKISKLETTGTNHEK